MPTITREPIGCTIAQRITLKVCGHLLAHGAPLADYGTIADIVHGEISDIASEQEIGDWIETPNGTTYRLVFKPASTK